VSGREKPVAGETAKGVSASAPVTGPVWSYKLGRRPHLVVVVERPDRGNALQLRYTDATGRHKPFLTSPHPQTVRGTDRRGNPCIDAVAEAAVQKLVGDVHAALVNGKEAAALIDPPPQVLATANAPEALTLRALVEAAAPARARVVGGKATAASLRGVYGADTSDAKEFRQLALRGVAALERVLRERGVAPLCMELEQSDWIEAGRRMLEDFKRSRPHRGTGLRTVERALGAVLRCGNWGCSASRIPLRSFMPPAEGWRKELRTHLERIRPAPLLRPAQLNDRLKEGEAGRLLALAFDLSADLDPRFRLALVLGFPLRLGQVARWVWRSCVRLGPIGEYGVGRVHVAASGNKPSASFDLHPDERAVLDALLKEPLRQLEAAYGSGMLADYPMMPAGRMRRPKGKRDGEVPFVPGRELRPVSSRRLLEWYEQAERWVGIRHVPGRSWYALRRTCTDAGAAVTTDAEVRYGLAGWHEEGTRRRYRNAEDERLQANVGKARAALRALLLSQAPTPAAHLTHPKPALVGRDSEEKRASHEAAAETRAALPGRHRRRLKARGVRKSSGIEGPQPEGRGRDDD
jgi:hypothetical protein